jgi:hypothetical protein
LTTSLGSTIKPATHGQEKLPGSNALPEAPC